MRLEVHSGLVTRLICMQLVDYEYLRGSQNKTAINELSIAGENVLETFHLQSPYPMRLHGDQGNGLNGDDGRIAYNQLSTVLR